MVWTPRVTVAALSEQNAKFLFVEELDANGRHVFNQPAGHLENGESLIDAVVRETLEETGYHYQPTAISGIYRWIEPNSGDTYLRICFIGDCEAHDPERTLDEGIIAAHWFNPADISARAQQLRSPLVQQCLDDYLAGHRYPLSLLREF